MVRGGAIASYQWDSYPTVPPSAVPLANLEPSDSDSVKYDSEDSEGPEFARPGDKLDFTSPEIEKPPVISHPPPPQLQSPGHSAAPQPRRQRVETVRRVGRSSASRHGSSTKPRNRSIERRRPGHGPYLRTYSSDLYEPLTDYQVPESTSQYQRYPIVITYDNSSPKLRRGKNLRAISTEKPHDEEISTEQLHEDLERLRRRRDSATYVPSHSPVTRPRASHLSGIEELSSAEEGAAGLKSPSPPPGRAAYGPLQPLVDAEDRQPRPISLTNGPQSRYADVLLPSNSAGRSRRSRLPDQPQGFNSYSEAEADGYFGGATKFRSRRSRDSSRSSASSDRARRAGLRARVKRGEGKGTRADGPRVRLPPPQPYFTAPPPSEYVEVVETGEDRRRRHRDQSSDGSRSRSRSRRRSRRRRSRERSESRSSGRRWFGRRRREIERGERPPRRPLSERLGLTSRRSRSRRSRSRARSRSRSGSASRVSSKSRSRSRSRTRRSSRDSSRSFQIIKLRGERGGRAVRFTRGPSDGSEDSRGPSMRQREMLIVGQTHLGPYCLTITKRPQPKKSGSKHSIPDRFSKSSGGRKEKSKKNGRRGGGSDSESGSDKAEGARGMSNHPEYDEWTGPQAYYPWAGQRAYQKLANLDAAERAYMSNPISQLPFVTQPGHGLVAESISSRSFIEGSIHSFEWGTYRGRPALLIIFVFYFGTSGSDVLQSARVRFTVSQKNPQDPAKTQPLEITTQIAPRRLVSAAQTMVKKEGGFDITPNVNAGVGGGGVGTILKSSWRFDQRSFGTVTSSRGWSTLSSAAGVNKKMDVAKWELEADEQQKEGVTHTVPMAMVVLHGQESVVLKAETQGSLRGVKSIGSWMSRKMAPCVETVKFKPPHDKPKTTIGEDGKKQTIAPEVGPEFSEKDLDAELEKVRKAIGAPPAQPGPSFSSAAPVATSSQAETQVPSGLGADGDGPVISGPGTSAAQVAVEAGKVMEAFAAQN